MPQNQGNFKVKVAAATPSKFNMNKKVVATHDFGTMQPIECKVCFPGDKIDVSLNQFTYLMPMPKPTFGRIDTINRAFFVPFRVLMKDWKEFISNQKVPKIVNGSTISSYTPVAPKTTISHWTNAFSLLCSQGTAPTGGQLGRIDSTQPSNYDYVITNYINGQVSKEYLTLSYMGRKLMSVFHGLGYNFPFMIYNSSGDDDENLATIGKKEISLLPLLAFARAYFDWVIPSRFISSHRNLQLAINSIHDGCTDVNSTGAYNDNTGIVKAALLIGLFKLYSSYLEDDFFTSAFVSTFGYEDSANVGSFTEIVNPNTVQNGDYEGVYSGDDGGIYGSSTVNTYQYIQQFTIKSLGALQDMINRGKVAGNKIQDFLRVTYGIKPSNETLDLSMYLGSNRKTIQIGAVMSNADTASSGGASLGQFAGRGLTNQLEDYGHFSLECKEHGIFIITNELQVRSSYWQGLRPECELLQREDFGLPELDNLGVDAIAKYQLAFCDLIGSDADSVSTGPDGVNHPFGFTPTYSKYKVNFDSLIGDFRFKTKNTGLDSWYLMRNFDVGDTYEIDENFSLMTQRNTSTQYDHIFQVADNSADHFYSVFNLNFTKVMNLKPISEALETEEGSKVQEVKFNGGVE